MTAKVTRKGDMLVLGNDAVRIEEGPALITETATAELLHDDNTAKHYYAGVRPMEFVDALGKPYSVPAVGRDALGNPIKIGEPMSYLAHGGDKRLTKRCFYIYKRRDVDPTTPTLENGDINPHFVPEHVRKGANLVDDGTPPNRTHYTYVFDEVDTVPITPGKRDAAEQQAIERASKLIKESD
jgi:hypothetical protein